MRSRAKEARVFAARRDELVALETSAVRDVGAWVQLRGWLDAGGVAAPIVADDAAVLVRLRPAGLHRSGDAVLLRGAVTAEDLPVLEAMLDEIAAAREDEAARRAAVAAIPTGLRLKVNDNKRHAILMYPEGVVEKGVRDVRVEGDPYQIHFVKIAANKATTRDGGPNALGAILAGLFGPDAGKPGTDHSVILREHEGRMTLEPVIHEETQEGPALPFYADLGVACGLGPVQHEEAGPRAIRVHSERRLDPRRHFVVRARGDSMNGGARPIRDGDLVLCQWLPGAPPDLVEGKACWLVATVGPEASEAMIKVPKRTAGDTWLLRSGSPGQGDRAIARWDELRVVARVLKVVTAA